MTCLYLVVLVLAGPCVLSDNVEMSSENGEQSQNCNGGYMPKDCGEIDKKKGSGVYKIYPIEATLGFEVYCNMDIDDCGWTVIQRRVNGETDFCKNWTDYENGFGDLKKEFWLGNQKLYTITKQGKYELRVDLEDFENNRRHAKYDTFSVGTASSKYKLTVGGYKGDAGDAMTFHNGGAFSTIDNDNDELKENCALIYKGGWWYTRCHHTNLNGPYLKGQHKTHADGVEWYEWKGYYYSLKTTSLMIRQLS